MSVSADLFREVFRRWPSGAAIVTASHEGTTHGMIVGSFCSLSAEPPLVMVSAGTTTRTHDLIDGGGAFAVSILGEEQRAIFARFAGIDRAFDADRFTGLPVAVGATGLPLFPDALAWVECRVVARHPGAGYTIFVGEIVNASLGTGAEANPLVYFRRTPGTFVARED
jgi:flavin reductase (DIM6/NTAB) family NADH-FMN oxidoreductase RutF